MITLGTVVFVGGILLGWPIPAMVGCILIMAGLVLGVLGATGHPVGQRRHWY